MKKKIIVAALVAGTVLTGCASGPDLSDSYRNMEAEYMAGMLLKYDENYGDMLEYDRDILKPTVPPEPTQRPKPKATKAPEEAQDESSGSSGEGAAVEENIVDAGKLLSTGGINITPQRYELKKSYGSSDATIEAGSGRKLLVVKFRVKNTSGKAKKVDMMGRDLQYSLEVDGSGAGSPEMTVLDNDLQFFKSNMSAGDSKEAVLVFKIGSNTKLENVILKVSDGTGTARLPLQ